MKRFSLFSLIIVLLGGYLIVHNWTEIKTWVTDTGSTIISRINSAVNGSSAGKVEDPGAEPGEDIVQEPVSTKVVIDLTDDQYTRLFTTGGSFYLIDGTEYASWGDYCTADKTDVVYDLSMYNDQGNLRWYMNFSWDWDDVPYDTDAFVISLTIDGSPVTVTAKRSGSSDFSYTWDPEQMFNSLLLRIMSEDRSEAYFTFSISNYSFHSFSVDRVVDWNNNTVYENV